MNPEQEVQHWLSNNKQILMFRSSDEVMELARMCLSWIDPKVLYRELSHYFMDRETNTHYKTREAWYVDRELDFQRKDLLEKWNRVARQERGLDE